VSFISCQAAWQCLVARRAHSLAAAMSREGDEIWNACEELVKQLELDGHVHNLDGPLSTERMKMVKKMKDYFKKPLKEFNYNQDLEMCVSEYADCALGALFCGMGDRSWLEHADFLMVLHFAVKENFPVSLIRPVPDLDLEEVILQAHDRSLDEQRWLHGRWGLVKETVSGKSAQKKVQEAIDESRKSALAKSFDEHFSGEYQKTPEKMEDFVREWVVDGIKRLNVACQGDPDSSMSQSQAVEFFKQAVNASGVPAFMLDRNTMQPLRLVTIEGIVREAYESYGTESEFTRIQEGDWKRQVDDERKKAMRGKGRHKGKSHRSHGGRSRSRSLSTPPRGGVRGGASSSETPERRRPGLMMVKKQEDMEPAFPYRGSTLGVPAVPVKSAYDWTPPADYQPPGRPAAPTWQRAVPQRRGYGVVKEEPRESEAVFPRTQPSGDWTAWNQNEEWSRNSWSEP